VIRPESGWAALDVRELWRFRDLLLTLAAREVKLRYRQTALGVAWVVLQPLLTSGIFTVVFGIIAALPTDGLPPFLFSYAGLLGWVAFSNTLSKGGTSLVGNAHLVSKVYFPRLALPLSTVFSTLIDVGVALIVMVPLMVHYRIAPGMGVMLAPVWLALFLMLGAGFGLLTSALTVRYRDVQYIVPVLVMMLQYISPFGYSTERIKPSLLQWYMLNPLAGLTEALRWSLLGRGTVHWPYVWYAAAVSVLVLVAGAIFFKRMERQFADII